MVPVAPLPAPLTHNHFPRDDSRCRSVDLNGTNNQAVSPASNGNKIIPSGLLEEHTVEEHANSNGLQKTLDAKVNIINTEEAFVVDRETGKANCATPQKQLNGKRKVHWNDYYGNELVEIWEFEPSDSSDSEDDEDEDSQACTCVIM